MYARYSKSIPQKLFIVGLETLLLWASYWILFQGGFEQIAALFHWNVTPGDPARHTVLFIFNCIVYARMLLTMFYLLSREIPWEEAFSIPVAFALYYVGYALLGYQARASMGWLDWFGIALFILGSFTNTYSELQRKAWKQDPAHKGQIYTAGLFRYSMHINFFGDLVWVVGYAILTRNPYSILIPLLLFSLFAFYNIPALDKHLAEHYGGQFVEFSQKTKKFIPFVY